MIAQRFGLGLAVASLLAYAREIVGAPAWTAPLPAIAAASTPYGAQLAWPRPSRWLGALLAAAAVAALFGAWHAATAWPSGAWDAVELWNHRALSRARGTLGEMFASATRHADYPLLLPLTVAPLWEISEAIPGPMLVGAVFGTLTVGLLFQAVSERVGGDPAALATAVLLATPLFAVHPLSQRADIPLAFYALAAIVALDRRQWIALGLALGAAAWTKNEGLVWAFAGLGAAAWVGRGDAWRSLVAFAPFAVSVAAHRLLSGPGDLAGGELVLSRVPAVAWAFANAVAFPVGLAAGLAWATGPRGPLRVETRTGVALLALVMAAYAGACLVTPTTWPGTSTASWFTCGPRRST